jgi:hypothetical protein
MSLTARCTAQAPKKQTHQRHRERAVARKHADLDRAPRAGELGQQRQKRALLGRHLHVRAVHAGGGLAQAAQGRVLARVV